MRYIYGRVRWRVAVAAVVASALVAVVGVAATAQGSTAVSAANLAKAKALLKAAEAVPTSVNMSQSLGAKPRKGGYIAFVESRANASETIIYDSLVQAGKYFGYTVKWFDTGSTSDQYYAAFSAAAAAIKSEKASGHLVGAAVLGNNPKTWAQWYKTWLAQGVPMFAESTGLTNINDKVMANASGAQGAKAESALADWAIATANGPANMLVVEECTDIPIFCEISKGPVEQLHALCPSCKATLMNVLLTDVGTQIPSEVVSFLQKNPSYKYVVFTMADGVTAGVYTALKVAGLSDVKVGTAIGGTADLAALKTGEDSINQSWSAGLQSFAAADFFARSWTGQSTAQDGNWFFPTYLQTAKAISNPNQLLNYPLNWESLFLKLWGFK